MINENDVGKLKKINLNRTGEMNIIVEMVDEIEVTRAGKRKFNVSGVEG